MDAYIISLNNPEFLIKQIHDFGLNPILINGVNGKQLSRQEINENTTFMCSLFCPKSSIGIAMSHIKAWEEFLLTKKKNALVFEDDVVFTKNFKKEFDTDMQNVPNDFDLFYLGCFGCTNTINIYTIAGTTSNLINLNSGNINKYINKPSFILATHAYVISRKGAKKLITHFKNNISYHLDFVIQTLIRDNVINAYGLNKRIVYQTSTDDTMSTNVSTNHPALLNDIISNYYLDTKVKASYATTMVIVRIGNINLSIFSVLFILTGILLSTIDTDIYIITIGYLLLSSKDIFIDHKNIMILVHYLLLIIPFIIFKHYNLWSKIDTLINNIEK